MNAGSQSRIAKASKRGSSDDSKARWDEVSVSTLVPKMRTEGLRAYFGQAEVLKGITLPIAEKQVTAVIGPSGCGKSTFVRCLNRMHEVVPGARATGQVLLDTQDIYHGDVDAVRVRRRVGMVFQKPNPFPTMSIRDNVLAGLRLNGERPDDPDAVVEKMLQRVALWDEVKDILGRAGTGLSGGQQQRLCIARSLAIQPRVLLMDEPCSALDPTSTRVIEETMIDLAREVTIVIVTHNMQQAARVSDKCAFFLASQGTPGVIVEHGDTEAMFTNPQDSRTADYVNGRFG